MLRRIRRWVVRCVGGIIRLRIRRGGGGIGIRRIRCGIRGVIWGGRRGGVVGIRRSRGVRGIGRRVIGGGIRVGIGVRIVLVITALLHL